MAKGMVVPPGIALPPLSPCTPESPPVEPPWPLVREAVANRGFTDVDEMELVLEGR